MGRSSYKPVEVVANLVFRSNTTSTCKMAVFSVWWSYFLRFVLPFLGFYFYGVTVWFTFWKLIFDRSNDIFLAYSDYWRRRSCWPRPHCQGVHNVFHLTDPLASRLEPLLSALFANARPMSFLHVTSATHSVTVNLLYQDTCPLGPSNTTSRQTGNGLLSKRR